MNIQNNNKKKKNRDFPGRLSRLFIFWFSLALLVPVSILLYFTADSFADREELLAKTVSENQKYRVLELEEFFESRFNQSYRNIFKQIMADNVFGPPVLEMSEEKAFELGDIYLRNFLPRLGIKISTESLSLPLTSPSNKLLREIEQNSPIRAVLAINNLKREQGDFFDVLGYGLVFDRNLFSLHKRVNANRAHLKKELLASLENSTNENILPLSELLNNFENSIYPELELNTFQATLYMENLLSYVKNSVRSAKHKDIYLADGYRGTLGVYQRYCQFLKDTIVDLQKHSISQNAVETAVFTEIMQLYKELLFEKHRDFFDTDKLQTCLEKLPLLRRKIANSIHWLSLGFLSEKTEVQNLLAVADTDAFYSALFLVEQAGFQKRYAMHRNLELVNNQLRNLPELKALSRAISEFTAYYLRLLSSEQILSIMFFRKRLAAIAEDKIAVNAEDIRVLRVVHADFNAVSNLNLSAKSIKNYLNRLQQERAGFFKKLNKLRKSFYGLREIVTANLKLLDFSGMRRMSLSEVAEQEKIFVLLDNWFANDFSDAFELDLRKLFQDQLLQKQEGTAVSAELIAEQASDENFIKWRKNIKKILQKNGSSLANTKAIHSLEEQIKALRTLLFEVYKTDTDSFRQAEDFFVRLVKEQLFEAEWDTFFFALDPFEFPLQAMAELVRLSDTDKNKSHRVYFRNYYNQVHYIFNFDIQDEIRGDSDWSPLQKFIESVLRYSFFHYYFAAPNELRLMEQALGVSHIRKVLGEFLNYKLGKGQMEVVFGVYPCDFPQDEYYAGLTAPPRMTFGGVIKMPQLREWFRLIFNKISTPIKEADLIEYSGGLRVIYDGENPEKHPQMVFDDKTDEQLRRIIFELSNLKYGLSEKNVSTPSFRDFLHYIIGLRLGNPSAMQVNQEWNKATEMGLISKNFTAIEAELSKLDFDQESRLRFQNWLTERRWFDLEGLLFKKDGREYLGSLFPSDRLGMVTFLSLPIAVAEKDIVRLKYLLVSVIICTFIFAMSLGRALFLRIVIPVLDLTAFVNNFSRKIGEFVSEIDTESRAFLTRLFTELWRGRTERKDEIGALYDSFHGMTVDVVNKLEESFAGNVLNEGLLKGHDLSVLLRESCRRLISLSEAKLVCFGFFEADSQEKISFFVSLFATDLAKEDKRLVEESKQTIEEDKQAVEGDKETAEEHELTAKERELIEEERKQRLIQETELKKEILALIHPIFSEAREQKIWHFTNSLIGDSRFENVYLRLIEASSGDKDEEQMVKRGFLLVADYNNDFLSDSRELFLNSFCRQIVTVVSKAILDKMEKEAGKGRSVQLGLLPKAAPDSGGRFDIDFSFVAAKYLGGDFFDFLEFADNPQIGMIISDVSGKGIGPSLFGATCKVFLQWYSLDRNIAKSDEEKSPVMPPGEVLCAANDKLCEEKKNNLFATIFYCVADTETLELSYASAGHNKMFHVTAAGEIIELSAKGVPLGLFSPMFYQTKKLQLSVGDWIILYTDGVTELEDPVLELYDMTRLRLFIKRHLQLSATVFKEDLEKELEMYRKGVLFDGITLLRRNINFFNNFYRRQLSDILEFSGLEKAESERLFNEFTEQFPQNYFTEKNDYFENNVEVGLADATIDEIEQMLEELFTEYTKGQKAALSGEGAGVFLNMVSQLDSRLYEEGALFREGIIEEVKEQRRKIAEKGLNALNTGVAASDDITFIILRVNN